MRLAPHSPNRRRLCAGIAGLALFIGLPSLPACSSFQPEPFRTGKTVSPPQGCTQLLKRDRRGDC